MRNEIMPWLRTIVNLDKRLASSFAIAIVFAIISFIAGQLYEKNPQLRYEIQSQAPVFNVREDVTTLDIIFQGQSIRQQTQMLSLVTVKVQNSGRQGLSKQV